MLETDWISDARFYCDFKQQKWVRFSGSFQFKESGRVGKPFSCVSLAIAWILRRLNLTSQRIQFFRIELISWELMKNSPTKYSRSNASDDHANCMIRRSLARNNEKYMGSIEYTYSITQDVSWKQFRSKLNRLNIICKQRWVCRKAIPQINSMWTIEWCGQNSNTWVKASVYESEWFDRVTDVLGLGQREWICWEGSERNI